MNGFLSYSHDDHDKYEAFAPHLAALKRAYGLIPWTDHKITAGTLWEKAIDDAIAAADVFVLLVSHNFIASDYVNNVELPAIKSRWKAGALILPVVLVQCYWEYIARHIDAVPKQAGKLRPVADWNSENNGFNCAREQMMKSINCHFAIAPAPSVFSP